MKAVLAAIAILLVALPSFAQGPAPEARLVAVMVSNDGYLVGFVLSVHSLHVYVDHQGRPFEVRYQTHGDFEYDLSPDDEVESVAGVNVECDGSGKPKRIGLVEFVYGRWGLSSAGRVRIDGDYVPGGPWLVTDIDGVRIRYEPHTGRVRRIGGATIEYGPFDGPLRGISGTVRHEADVAISIVSDLCP